jgi:hypothetical protein
MEVELTSRDDLGFRISKIERLNKGEFEILIQTKDGNEIAGIVEIREVRQGDGTIRIASFVSQSLQDAMNSGAIIAKPIAEVLSLLDRME